jgi:hypothetical protein
MGQRAENSYAFIAFDHLSKGILACGPTAALALRDADLLAPDAPIDILNAGTLGGKIWAKRMDLGAAREVMITNPIFGLA